MEIINGTIRSEIDQLDLSYEIMIPDHIKGVVQFSHGMCEYKERYEPFMEYLANKGYVACIHDHRGHGGSVKKIDDLGFFYNSNYDSLVEDLHLITKLLKERFPGQPLYMFSHSMGTLVSRNYLKKYACDLDKLVLCGPPTYNPFAKLALKMTLHDTKKNGERKRNQRMTNLAFFGFNRDGKNSWLSMDKDNVEAYNSHPLCGFVFTNNAYAHLFSLLINAYDKDNWSETHLDIPILIVAGKDDPVIQSEAKIGHLISFLTDRGYNNVYCHLYEGLRHEILNEACKATIYKDLYRFFEKG